MPSKKDYRPKKYLDDGTLNPKWKPRPSGPKQNKYLEDRTLNPKWKLRPGEIISDPETILNNRKKRNMKRNPSQITLDEIAEYKNLERGDQLSKCPLCLKQCAIEERKLKLGEKRRQSLYGLRYFRGVVIGPKEDEIIFTESEWIVDYHKRTVRGRTPSCEECDTVSKAEMKTNWDRRKFRELARNENIKSTQVTSINRFEIFNRDQGICHICGGLVDQGDFHLDHVIPISRGGTHTHDNIKIAHPMCNLKKSNRITTE